MRRRNGQVATSDITTVVERELRFSKTQLNVGRSFQSSVGELSITRMAGSVPLALAEQVQVTLTSSDPSKVGVSTTVLIPGGASSWETVPAIRGLEFTSGTPVTIGATAPGYRSPPAPLQVSVVNGVIRLCDVLTSRAVGEPRDEATVCAGVQAGSDLPEVPSANWSVSLSVANPSQPGIIPGFFNQAIGGTPITFVFWPANAESSVPFFIGSPTVDGTYQVAAFMTTGATALSDTVAVGGASGPFRIFRSSANGYTVLGVGKGMRTHDAEAGIERTGSAATPLTVTLRCVSAVICRVQPSIDLVSSVRHAAFNSFSIEGLELRQHGSRSDWRWLHGNVSGHGPSVQCVLADARQFPYTVAHRTVLRPPMCYIYVRDVGSSFSTRCNPCDFDLSSNAT